MTNNVKNETGITKLQKFCQTLCQVNLFLRTGGDEKENNTIEIPKHLGKIERLNSDTKQCTHEWYALSIVQVITKCAEAQQSR